MAGHIANVRGRGIMCAYVRYLISMGHFNQIRKWILRLPKYFCIENTGTTGRSTPFISSFVISSAFSDLPLRGGGGELTIFRKTTYRVKSHPTQGHPAMALSLTIHHLFLDTVIKAYLVQNSTRPLETDKIW